LAEIPGPRHITWNKGFFERQLGLRSTMEERSQSARQRGLEVYRQVFGHDREMDSADSLARLTVDHLFANVWCRPGLSLRDRSMITVALLAAQGRDTELRSHLKGASNQGISAAELEEIMIHVAHYAGWAAGHHGLTLARAEGQGGSRSEDASP
jgi:4-carboxymuconolactone decarboxylase